MCEVDAVGLWALAARNLSLTQGVKFETCVHQLEAFLVKPAEMFSGLVARMRGAVRPRATKYVADCSLSLTV